jgi:hypothetical protein
VWAFVAGAGRTLTASGVSDIASAVEGILASRLSDMLSAAVQINSRVLLNLSRVSDTYSLLSDFSSNFESRVATSVGTVSQMAAAVWAEKYTAPSNVHASTFGSAFRLTMSRVSDLQSTAVVLQSLLSDTYSQLSDFRSDLGSLLGTTGVQLNASMLSDLRSAIAAGPAGALTVSDISDIASAVRALLVSDLSDILSAAVQVNSRVLVNQSRVSDTYSLLSDLFSDFQSRVPKGVATQSQVSDLVSDLRSYLVGLGAIASDAHSAAAQANSRALVVQSLVSDVDSALTSRFSDLLSLVTTTGVQLNASTMSDLRSAVGNISVTLTASDISDIASAVATAVTFGASDISDIASAVADVLASRLSDILSAAAQANSRALVLQSLVSDVDSALTSRFSDLLSLLGTTGVQLNASTLSDLRSAVAAIVAGVSASDMSDIASAVRAMLASDLSDILSAAAQANSRTLVLQSLVSDVDSALTSRFSDLASLVTTTGVQLNASSLSDIRSAVNAAQFTLTTSDISDIASAVGVALSSDLSDMLSVARQVNSRVLRVQSDVSDVASTLSDVSSDIGVMYALVQSRVPKAVATNSQVTAVHSDLRSVMQTTGVVLTTAGARAAADEFLNRNIAGGGSGGPRTWKQALQALRNRTTVVTGTLTVYAEDDTTPSWTAAVGTAAGDPIVSIDPA